MYNLKKTLFLYLTPRQRSQLFAHIFSLTKKNMDLEIDEILGKFLDDEIYYNKLGSPHFEFVIENLENDTFIKELKMFIKASKYHFEYLAKQEPYMDKQKEFLKKQKEQARIKKMQKMPPTQKQVKYYKALIRSHKLEEKSLDGLSRWDLRNLIMEIIDKDENAKIIEEDWRNFKKWEYRRI